MHPIEQQTILVTGATAGLGRALAGALAGRGATVLAHGRDARRLAATADAIEADTGVRVATVRADLARLAEVDALADEVLAGGPLHALVCNAGVGFGAPGAARETSADGVELRFAVNHLAAFRLAHRLADRLAGSAPARIVQVASAGQQPLDPADPLTEHGYDGVTAYRRAKLAQVMAAIDLAAELARRGVTVNALHPATLMDTAMVRESGMAPVDALADGLAATLRLVVDPTLDGVTGRYFDGTRETRANEQAYDPASRGRVRRLSDELVERALAG